MITSSNCSNYCRCPNQTRHFSVPETSFYTYPSLMCQDLAPENPIFSQPSAQSIPPVLSTMIDQYLRKVLRPEAFQSPDQSQEQAKQQQIDPDFWSSNFEPNLMRSNSSVCLTCAERYQSHAWLRHSAGSGDYRFIFLEFRCRMFDFLCWFSPSIYRQGTTLGSRLRRIIYMLVKKIPTRSMFTVNFAMICFLYACLSPSFYSHSYHTESLALYHGSNYEKLWPNSISNLSWSWTRTHWMFLKRLQVNPAFDAKWYWNLKILGAREGSRIGPVIASHWQVFWTSL